MGLEKRGVTEVKHGRSRSAPQVPPPNKNNEWLRLDPLQHEGCLSKPDKDVRDGASALLADMHADRMDLDAVLSDDDCSDDPHVQPAALASPLNEPAAAVTEPAAPGPVLNQALSPVEPAAASAVKLQPAQVSPGGGTSAGSDTTTMIPPAHDRHSDEDADVDVVGTSPRAKWRELEDEAAPMQHDSRSDELGQNGPSQVDPADIQHAEAGLKSNAARIAVSPAALQQHGSDEGLGGKSSQRPPEDQPDSPSQPRIREGRIAGAPVCHGGKTDAAARPGCEDSLGAGYSCSEAAIAAKAQCGLEKQSLSSTFSHGTSRTTGGLTPKMFP